MAEGNGKALGMADILSADDHRLERVEVPEWGGAVYLRSIGGNDRDRIEEKVSKGVVVGLRASLVASSLCNEQGEPLAPTVDEVNKLGQKNAAVLDRLFGICQTLSGFDNQEDQEGN